MTFFCRHVILIMSKVFYIFTQNTERVIVVPVGAMIFLGAVLLVFTVLDVIMIVSLLRPGDERSQVVVWKASAFTLLATVGATVLDVAESFVRGSPATINPLIHLETIAILYCASLFFYKKKLGG